MEIIFLGIKGGVLFNFKKYIYIYEELIFKLIKSF